MGMVSWQLLRRKRFVRLHYDAQVCRVWVLSFVHLRSCPTCALCTKRAKEQQRRLAVTGHSFIQTECIIDVVGKLDCANFMSKRALQDFLIS